MKEKTIKLPITILPGSYTISRLPSGSAIPEWVDKNRFWSATDTGEEMSIICSGEAVPEDYPHRCSMKIFKINSKLDFDLTGILNAITTPLAEKGIPVFTVSTFDTDYFLIQMERANDAVEALSPYHEIDYYSW